MHVTIVARGVPSERHPLWGIFEFDQARALAAAGHQVSIAALDLRSLRRRRPLGYRREVREGVAIHQVSLPLGRVPAALENRGLDRALEHALARIERSEGQPEVVHAHFTKYAAAAARSRRRADWPLVVTEHRSLFTPQSVPADLLALGRVAYPGADRVLAVSTALAQVLAQNFAVQPQVVPNVVDLATFRAPTRVPHQGIRLVSVGNLVARKQMALLVDGFAAAFANRPEVSLAIIGDGDQRQNLAARIHEAGLGDRVSLLGRLDRRQIASEFARSDAFCLLSTWETFGVAHVEAMAAGLPVLASRCGGPEDFVTATTGRFTEAQQAGDLARDLADFVAELPSFDRQAVAAAVTQRFSPATVAGQLGEVYHQVRQGRTTA